MTNRYKSVFDIIEPVMVGPSSSHTAGAVAIGRAGNKLFGGVPRKVTVHYYGSFAQTHRGHGTDYAIAAGILADQRKERIKCELLNDEFRSIHHR
ncbi:serine dehydratase beta chain [Lactobacillus helveticus]|uniref:serine dehydratase beta chain n=1 Tax=Lactobacillus helveticus TaxID=1587 RepID=UPI001D1792BB|nr:serine dehydratase beta chain [Lactobacillus helveticus]